MLVTLSAAEKAAAQRFGRKEEEYLALKRAALEDGRYPATREDLIALARGEQIGAGLSPAPRTVTLNAAELAAAERFGRKLVDYEAVKRAAIENGTWPWRNE